MTGLSTLFTPAADYRWRDCGSPLVSVGTIWFAIVKKSPQKISPVGFRWSFHSHEEHHHQPRCGMLNNVGAGVRFLGVWLTRLQIVSVRERQWIVVP